MNRLRTTGFLGFLALGVLLGAMSCQASTAQKESNTAQKKNSPQPMTILQNGNMSLGTNVPGFWHHQWVGKGKIKISRDTQVFKAGPAALTISSLSSPAKGQVSQLIKGSPGQSFTLSGFAKSAGDVTVNVAVQALSKKSRPISFQSVQSLQNDQDWTAFSQPITLPPDTKKFSVVLLLEGQGQAWLDEVKLSGEGVKNIAGNLENLPPPKKQDPTVPIHGYFPKYPQAWLSFHKQHLKQTRKRKIKIAFLGDSITRGWKNHKPLWKKHYGDQGAANFGIGSDRTQQILWRIEHGLFDHMQPELVVLNIGVNNLFGKSSGAKKIAAGVEKIVNTIHSKSPQTKILLLGIFPTGKQPNKPIRKKISDINALLAQLDNDKNVRFLDIGEQFLEPDGQISKSVMPDYLHLSRKGYQIWANSMDSQFKQMLKE